MHNNNKNNEITIKNDNNGHKQKQQCTTMCYMKTFCILLLTMATMATILQSIVTTFSAFYNIVIGIMDGLVLI